MAQNLEIIKIISSLLPPYDGNKEKLENVIDALGVIETLITDSNRVTVINVILTKFTGKARNAFGVKPESIATIQAKLKEIITPTPPETIITKLESCKQKNDVNSFTTEIELLTLQLESAYIAKKIPSDVAKELATKEGIKYMAKGLKNENTALILRAGSFKQLNEAINKVMEVNPSCEKSLLFTKSTSKTNGLGNTNTHNRHSNRNANQQTQGNRFRFDNRLSSRPIQPTCFRCRNGNYTNDNQQRMQNYRNDFRRNQANSQPNRQNWRNNNNLNVHNPRYSTQQVYSVENVSEPLECPLASCARTNENNEGEMQETQIQHPRQ